jgi:hypothetical protein
MNGVANGLYGGDLPNQINTPWIDFSEQSTIVGWSVYTVKIIRYKVVGNSVFVHFVIQGTSNSTSTTFTLPFTPKTGISVVTNICGAVNSSANNIAWTTLTSGSNTVSFLLGTGATIWTNTGTKGIQGQFFYEI